MTPLLIACPHCRRDVYVPANVETTCPRCRKPIIAEALAASPAPKPAAPFRGGALLYFALLVLIIPLVLMAALWVAPHLPDLSGFVRGSPLLFMGLLVYFLPSVIASSRHATNSGLIFLLNLLTGVTVIGWIAAFIWAAVDKPAQA